MKRLLLSLILTTLCISVNFAQIDFQEIITAGLPAVSQGSSSFTDVDADGDIDVFISGNNFGTYISRIYLNNGNGEFSLSSNTLTGVSLSSSSFIDIDGDSDDDLIYFGFDQALNRLTKLYVNDGNGNFTEDTNSTFTGMNTGDIAVADVDNDNDMDILLSGEIGAVGVTELYMNNGNGQFTLTTDNLQDVASSTIEFADLDNDNDQDLILLGFNQNIYYGNVYLNNGTGNFSLYTNANLQGVAFGALSIKDFDNDGFNDVVLSGRFNNSFNSITSLYLNNGDAIFSLQNTVNLEGIEDGSIGAADFNQDGLLDLITTGINNSNQSSTKLYYGDNNSGFIDSNISCFPNIHNRSHSLVADLDNDNDEDVVIIGSDFTSIQIFGEAYRNIPLNVIAHPDYNALVDLYNTLNGDNWFNNTNWLDTTKPISKWQGITETNGRVTQINLRQNNLTGVLPNTIEALSELTFIDLSENNISGEIPNTLGNLTNLSWINLDFNGLSGSIPQELTNLSALNVLVLSNNFLSGAIPDFTTLPLNNLWLNNNNFQFGDLEPNFNTYIATTSLNYVYTPQNFPNVLPEFKVVSIGDDETFNIIASGNNNIYTWHLNGAVIDANTHPNISGLGTSSLSVQNITNSELGKYECFVTNTTVTNLSIYGGRFDIGLPPESHPDYDALVELYNALNGSNWNISNNNWLDNTKPISAWWGITETNNRVTGIQLSQGNVTGSIPNEITQLSELEVFWIQNAFITGEIPSNIGDLNKLRQLVLFETFGLTGSIPESIKNCTNLEWLYLNRNQISGSIPDLTGLPNLAILSIEDNKFQFGDFENEFANYQNTMGNNFIFSPQKNVGERDSAVVPLGESITLTTNVSGTQNNYSWFRINADGSQGNFIASGETLNVTINTTDDYKWFYYYQATSSLVPGLTLRSENFKIGDLPSKHPDYQALLAVYNALNGPNWNNPWDLSKPIENWNDSGTGILEFDTFTNRLIRLNLPEFDDNVTGEIPIEIGNLTELENFSVFSSQVSGEVPNEIWGLTKLRTLLLGGQDDHQLRLSNGIPASIANLQDLEWLNLTNMPLQQPLQPELFNLPNLSRLRIENCGLSGTLPKELASIDDVLASGNAFEGTIPQEFLNATGNFLLTISNNFFDFNDLEPLVQSNGYQNLFYNPQRTKDEELDLDFVPGSDITLTIDDTRLNKSKNSKDVGDIYQWFKDNIAITGANASSYTIINAQDTDSGVYFCQITNNIVPDLIINRANITLNIEASLSFEETNKTTFSVYPNPTKNYINIKLDKANVLVVPTIALFDINGRHIKTQALSTNNTIIDVSNLQSGIYILQLKTEGKITTKRFIKE